MIVLLLACHGRGRSHEVVYVSAPQAFLRDQVAQVFAKVATVKNGDRLEVLDHDRRFTKVRTSAGLEGWIEQRNIVTQKVYDGFQKLGVDNKGALAQATAVTRNDLNLHLTPGRETEHLYQSLQGSKLSLLKRETVEKVLPGTAPRPVPGDPKAPPPMEDWWLVRDTDRHAGWALGRMLDIDIPLEIAQYAEGQRPVAALVLDQVTDGDKQVPQYLVLLTENKDGMPYDYNQLRVFTWNVRRHRYETAYRERNLDGVFPAAVSHENFDKEGNLPVFVVHVKDEAGNVIERKYKLNTPIVHRVLAPGDVPQKPAAKKNAAHKPSARKPSAHKKRR